MRTIIYLFVCALALPSCRPSGPKELDLPNTITGAEAIQFSDQIPIRTQISSSTLKYGYRATISHGYFSADPDEELDFVEVAIEYPGTSGIYVSMMKAFALEDLPSDILKRHADQIVSQTDDSIVFDLGSVTVTADKPWKR